MLPTAIGPGDGWVPDNDRWDNGPMDARTKPCASCGRVITWRRAWARTWDDVTYCSDRCRSRRVTPVDERLAEAIIDLLGRRSAAATICPSEAARAVGGERWRDLMEPARAAARRLVAQGRVQITQGGRVVDPSTAKGPIRLRLTAGREPSND